MQNAAKITQIHVVAVRAVPNTNESRARKVSSTGFELNSERRMNEWTFLVCDERYMGRTYFSKMYNGKSPVRLLRALHWSRSRSREMPVVASTGRRSCSS